MEHDRRDDLLDLIQKLQLEIGSVMENWADRLAAPIPRHGVQLAAHIAGARQAGVEIVALADAADALRLRLQSGSTS